MLKALECTLANLSEILVNPEIKWNSLVINRRKPVTYRVFAMVGDYRICLHKFEPCDTHEAFMHPHPWPGAFIILKGCYRMKLGYTCGGLEDHSPTDVCELILQAGSMYAMDSRHAWHSVIPLETTYTVMINGKSWEDPNTAVRRTDGKDLDRLQLEELEDAIALYRQLWEERKEALMKGPAIAV